MKKAALNARTRFTNSIQRMKASGMMGAKTPVKRAVKKAITKKKGC